MRFESGGTNFAMRYRFAAKAFAHTARYDCRRCGVFARRG